LRQHAPRVSEAPVWFGDCRTARARTIPMLEPNAPAQDPIEQPERRTFLTRIVLGVGGLIGLVLTAPVIGFLVEPIRRARTRVWRDIGRLDAFEVGKTVKVQYLEPDAVPWAGLTAENAAYVRRLEDDRFVAFSIYCTHTGCPIRWDEGSRLFICPCHGGAFNADGSISAGPPPKPLAQHSIRVEDGLVQIRSMGLPDVTGR
jgi:menaquinol-cytochrome c reductase iron-sulfur subunit